MPRTTTSAMASHAIGREVRRARQGASLTQAEVARRLGFSAPYLSAIENGHENLTVGQLWAIAEALDVEIHIELRQPSSIELPSIPSPPRRDRSGTSV